MDRERRVSRLTLLRVGPRDHADAADADVVEREPTALAGAALHYPDADVTDADDTQRSQLGAARGSAQWAAVRLFPGERGVASEREVLVGRTRGPGAHPSDHLHPQIALRIELALGSRDQAGAIRDRLRRGEVVDRPRRR